MRTALVCGAGGFIGSHLVKRLKREGVWVRGVDLKLPEFDETYADDFAVGDLRDQAFTRSIVDRRFDEIYQLAADMGGAGYLFTGENDANVMYNSGMIDLNVIQALLNRDIRRVFYSSSACIYPAYNQQQADSPNCVEGSAYPAAPAAMCRKIAQSNEGGVIDIWGDGQQTRSFLYIDECIEGTLRLMRSDISDPINIGSEEMVTINQLADLVADIAGKLLTRTTGLARRGYAGGTPTTG